MAWHSNPYLIGLAKALLREASIIVNHEHFPPRKVPTILYTHPEPTQEGVTYLALNTKPHPAPYQHSLYFSSVLSALHCHVLWRTLDYPVFLMVILYAEAHF